jgi:ribosomal-protein-alanine N-acetyltransferase
MSDYEFCTLGFADIDRVLQIEEQVYSHPWTRGNFHDSIYSGHAMIGLQAAGRLVNGPELHDLMAYYLLMPVVDEMHLLNFAVAADYQGLGHARLLLDHMCEYVRQQQCLSILLEVRVSNQRAIKVYQRYGFNEIGRRKSYYPMADNLREDAIVMRMEL